MSGAADNNESTENTEVARQPTLRELAPDFDSSYLEGLEGRGLDTVPKILKSHKELRAHQSTLPPKPPGEGATVEDYRKYGQHQAIGAPPDPGGYPIPEGVDGTVRSSLVALQNAAYDAGVSGGQWNVLQEAYRRVAHQQVEADAASAREKRSRDDAAWAKEHGEATSDKDKIVQRIQQKFFAQNPEIFETLAAQGLDGRPALKNLLLAVAAETESDSVPSSINPPPGGPTVGSTPKLAAQRIVKLRNNKALSDPSHADYEAVSKEFDANVRAIMSTGKYKSWSDALDD